MRDSDMIKSVLLDLDDTIFDFHRAEAAALTGMLTELEITPTEEVISLYSEINDRHWKMLELGTLTRDEVLTGRFESLFSEMGVRADAKRARELYEWRLGECHYFIDGAEKLLDSLYGEFDLYLASNGTDSVQTRRIAGAGIEKYFKDIFISQRLGADKPSAEYFERCFARIADFDRARTVIVGDSLSSDIKGGRNAGIKTVWYNPCNKGCGDITPDYEIKKLSELKELLMKI